MSYLRGDLVIGSWLVTEQTERTVVTKQTERTVATMQTLATMPPGVRKMDLETAYRRESSQ